MAAKRIQLLKEAVPTAVRMAVLWNPNNPFNKLELNEAVAAGKDFDLIVFPVGIRGLEDLDGAFSVMVRERAQALLIVSNPLTVDVP